MKQTKREKYLERRRVISTPARPDPRNASRAPPRRLSSVFKVRSAHNTATAAIPQAANGIVRYKNPDPIDQRC